MVPEVRGCSLISFPATAGTADGNPAHKQRVAGLNPEGCQGEICRPEIHGQAGLPVIFRPLGDGDRQWFQGRRLGGGLNLGARKSHRFGTAVIHRQS